MNKTRLSEITVNFIVFLFAVIAVLATSIGTPLFMSSVTILYYTIQSNIWIGLTCLAFAIIRLIQIKNSNLQITRWLYITKYVFTVAITLTMGVFWILLAPALINTNYLFTVGNIFAHTLTPVAALISFLAFDSRENQLSKKASLFSLITPVYYFLFVIIASSLGVTFHLYRAPYFFLDFYEFGWFAFGTYSEAYGFASFGVFYWVLLILGFIFLLGFGLVFLNRFLFRKFQQTKA